MSKFGGLHRVNSTQFVIAINMGRGKVRKEFNIEGWTYPES